ncbi:MAG: polymer-forming cytoskeletal protein [Bryobacteraceae bacterium]
MWNSKREEEKRQPPAPPSQPAFARSAQPSYAPAAEAPRGPVASLGQSVTIKGDITSQEDLFVDGEIEGKLNVAEHRLTIGPKGKIRAHVKAREVTIHGSVVGNIECAEKLTIKKEGSLVGDIKTSGIMIEDGAYFKGSIDITRGATAKPVNGSGERSQTSPNA